MSVQKEIPGKIILDRLAEEGGVAVAVVDRSSIEVSVSNNNSICSSLNPDGEMAGECRMFCGSALARATDAGAAVSFTCHAGLECRASAMLLDGRPVAVIVGRTFVKAENYRLSTERAIGGDWQCFAPSKFFENILLSGSTAPLDDVVERIDEASIDVESRPERPAGPVVSPADDDYAQIPQDSQDRENTQQGTRVPAVEPDKSERTDQPATYGGQMSTTDSAAWRSFFGSMLNTGYAHASHSILDLVAGQYGFKSLVWLENRGNRLVNTAAFGPIMKRRLKLGLAADDRRLVEAVRVERPLQLIERARNDEAADSTMSLFPLSVGSEITSSLAVLEPIADEEIMRQISRLCQSIAPRLEILRLRSEVTRRDSISAAVRKFSDSIKRSGDDDLWLHLTQVAAELMQAERGSLLVVDPASGGLSIRAAIGAHIDVTHDTEPGGRVAKFIFERGKPAVVADVAKTGLPPASAERMYKTPSFLSSPISIAGRNIGVINFTDKAGGGTFDRSDLELLQEITPQIAVAIDHAILKERAGEFEQLSVTDALTGLLNRRYIEERLIEEVKRSSRHGYPMCFLMVDVDHFKSYNDEFGHPAGDKALKLVAHVMKDTLRGADVAARFGGEEFAILLPQTTSDEAMVIAERLRANVAATEFPCRHVTVSIGVASCTSELCTRDGLVGAADKALYDAKHNGRNAVRAFDETVAN